MVQFSEHKVWETSEIKALSWQIESYFLKLEFDTKPLSTRRGSYLARRVKSKIEEPRFSIFLDELTEAAIFYSTHVVRLPRRKGGQVPDINRKVLLHDILTATEKLLNIPVGLYQIDPSTEYTRSEGFVIELARHISDTLKLPFPKYLHHLLKQARITYRI